MRLEKDEFEHIMKIRNSHQSPTYLEFRIVRGLVCAAHLRLKVARAIGEAMAYDSDSAGLSVASPTGEARASLRSAHDSQSGGALEIAEQEPVPELWCRFVLRALQAVAALSLTCIVSTLARSAERMAMSCRGR